MARSHGFDAVGFTAPHLPDNVRSDLQGFLDKKYHGDMQWMETHADRRGNPHVLWPEAKSIIVLGQNYGPADNPLQKLARTDTGVISCYAQGEDYHEVLKKKLKLLARAIAEQFLCGVKIFTDTAPVMEKPLAQMAGLGWQGKHTCIVSREFGSWLFLGEIFTTLELAPDVPDTDHCGTCGSCLDICPTQAFTDARKLDARRCISYLTIEHKGHIAKEFRQAMGNRIYGCDDCLAVCPWNKFAQLSQETAYHPREQLQAALLAELVLLDDAGFRQLFRKSPVKRIGRGRFIRNVLIAIGNSKDMSHMPCLLRLLSDKSELVRAMAVWALSQLASVQEYSRMRAQHLPFESDPDVAAEWKGNSPMADITIYTTPVCPYCVRAKELLKRKGHTNYKEVDVSVSAEIREEMMKKSGGKRSVPQIFINGTHVGGSDDLYALETAGKLDGLLAA